MANAVSGTSILEVRTTGSDTLNTGGFDPVQTFTLVDLACTTGTTGSSTTTVTSASNPWAAGDVGAWLFIVSGTNWFPGWYPITGFNSSGSITIDTRAGHWVPYPGMSQSATTNTSLGGCGSSATLSAGHFGVDFSQQDTAAKTWTSTLSISATALTDSSSSLRKVYIGNLIAVNGTYATISAFTNTGAMTLAGSATTQTSASGFLGGALGGIVSGKSSPAFAASLMGAGNEVWINGSVQYLVDATKAANVATGPCTFGSNATSVQGYSSIRGDTGIATLKWSANPSGATGMLAGNGNIIIKNIVVDGTSGSTNVQGIMNAGGLSYVNNCGAISCTTGFASGQVHNSYADACGTGFSFSIRCLRCVARNPTVSGFSGNSGYYSHCLCIGNATGSTVDGFLISGSCTFDHCTAVNMGRDGFRDQTNNAPCTFESCLAYGNAGWGWNLGSFQTIFVLNNCAGGSNTLGNYTQSSALSFRTVLTVNNFIAVTADPFVTDYTDLTPNSSASGGALLRNVDRAFPLVSFSDYADIGAVHHQGAGGLSLPPVGAAFIS